MRFELFVASRYLRAKRRQAVIGVITAISVAGVAAGVASLIVALAINNGFRQDLQNRLLGATSNVQLMRIQSGDVGGIHDWQQLLARLQKEPDVVAAAPAVYEPVMISRGARAAGGAWLKGIVPSYEQRVSDLLRTVKLGSAAALAEEPAAPPQKPEATQPSSLEGAEERVLAMPPIILGKDLAANIGATVGSVVLVTSPQGELTPFGMVPKYVRFKVVGIFESGFYDYDSTWAFIRLSDAQQLFGLDNLVSVIEFKIDDIYRADTVAKKLEQAAGKGFMATNWMEQNKAVFHALRLERVVTFITIGLIVFVAALNILISLIMMVMEKTQRHRRADVDGHPQVAGAPSLHGSGVADRRGRNNLGLAGRVLSGLGTRPLSLDTPFGRGLFHRLCPLGAAGDRWHLGGPGYTGDLVRGDALSVVVGGTHFSCRSAALRVAPTRDAANHRS